MSAAPPPDDLDRWLAGSDDPALAARLLAATRSARQRRELQATLQLDGMLRLAAEPPSATDLVADVQQRLHFDREGAAFAQRWRRQNRRTGRSHRLAWALAALVLLALGGGLTVWLAGSSSAPTMLLIDGRRQFLHDGLSIRAIERQRQIRWPARGLDCALQPGGHLRWLGPPATAQLHLEAGAVSCRLQRQPADPALSMRLPDLRLTVTGTRWHCATSEQGSLVAVTRGRVQVTAGKDRRQRRAGEIVVARRAGPVVWRDGDPASAERLLTAAAAGSKNEAEPKREPDPEPEPPPEQEPEPTVEAGPAGKPVFELLDAERATALQRGPAVLDLDATRIDPFHLILLPDSEKIRRSGNGLPNPWSSHNWEEVGRSALFTEELAGEQILVLRNIVGHGLLLGQWRPVPLPSDSSVVVDIDYRYRGAGMLALAASFGDGRSDPGVKAPPTPAGGWQRATFLCHLPPGEEPQPFTLMLFSQRIGSANDVLLRRVRVAPLVGSSTD